MNLLFRVLYAAHARGTHHKLALDALRFLSVDRADQWQRLFLAHAKPYIAGSKAPDDEFKDFKNHVLHPRDGYWGGAMDLAETWYTNLVADLKAERWSEAARAAGILSHYLSDPLHPFHTAQSEAENAIHRAVEWSISRAYDELWAEATETGTGAPPHVPQGTRWLREVVCAGADESNKFYEKLIAHYSIEAGVIDPPSGLDPVARRLVSGLLMRAARTIAVVFDRAIGEAAAAPPQVPLTLATLLATLEIPRQLLAKRLADAEDRRQVEAMYDELKTTGRVEESLPLDDRVVRDLHAAEVVAPRQAALATDRARRIAEGPAPPPGLQSEEATIEVVRRTDPAPLRAPAPALPAVRLPQSNATPIAVPPPLPRDARAAAADAEDVVLAAAAAASRARRTDRVTLSPADDVERAPAIGPRMAGHLAKVGIKSVAELLAADARDLAVRLASTPAGSRVDAATVGVWQQQARMVSTIPGLRGTHTFLFIGAGYGSVEAIAAAPADKLCADVLAYAATGEGQKLLREMPAPDMERIKAWAEAARGRRAA